MWLHVDTCSNDPERMMMQDPRYWHGYWDSAVANGILSTRDWNQGHTLASRKVGYRPSITGTMMVGCCPTGSGMTAREPPDAPAARGATRAARTAQDHQQQALVAAGDPVGRW